MSRTMRFNFCVIAQVFWLLACTEKTTSNNVNTTPSVTVINISGDKITQLQREAESGDPDAQYNLAYRYENGLDVPKDDAKALDLYEKSADQGHSEAKNHLDNRSKTGQ